MEGILKIQLMMMNIEDELLSPLPQFYFELNLLY